MKAKCQDIELFRIISILLIFGIILILPVDMKSYYLGLLFF